MITPQNIYDNYIKGVLESTGINFNIFTDAMEFRHAERYRNNVTTYINGLMTVSDPATEILNGGLVASAVNVTIEFLVPIEKERNGEYYEVTKLRETLSKALGDATVCNITDDNGTMYTGGVLYSLPTTGSLNMRDALGLSISYRINITIAYLANAINTSDVELWIDGDRVAFQQIKISRKPSLSADIFSNSPNGEAGTYAESTSFTIEIHVPALKGIDYNASIMYWMLGTEPANTPHSVELKVPNMVSGDNESMTIYKNKMIFGGGEVQGNGVSNLSYGISLVPYTDPEVVGG